MKHKHAHWIKIWADGEHIQWRNSTSFPWSDMLDSGNWDHFPEYTQFRIKPRDESFLLYADLNETALNICPTNGTLANLRLTFENKKLVKAEVLDVK